MQTTYQELINKGLDHNEAKLKSTKFFVEATSTEKFYLWKEHKDNCNWLNDNSLINCVGFNVFTFMFLN